MIQHPFLATGVRDCPSVLVPSKLHYQQKLRTTSYGTTATCRQQSRLVGVKANDNFLTIMVEVDGVAIDVDMDVHREAFNMAFQQLGIQCAQWKPEIYQDLLKRGDGTAVSLIKNYFAMVGWPSTVATSDYPALAQRIEELKEAALHDVTKQQIPVRRGFVKVISGALEQGCRVGLIGCTRTPTDVNLAPQVMKQMPIEYLDQVLTFQGGINSDKEQASDSDLASSLKAATERIKIRKAKEFLSSMEELKKQNEGGLDYTMGTGLLRPDSAVTMRQFSRWSRELEPTGPVCFLGYSVDLLKVAASANLRPIAMISTYDSHNALPEGCRAFRGFEAGEGLTLSKLMGYLTSD